MKYGTFKYGQAAYGKSSTALRIYNKALVFAGQIDNFSSCIITRKYQGIETLEMTIAFSAEVWQLLQKYYWIYAGPKRIFEIHYKDAEKLNPGMIKIIAYGGAKTFTKRVTMPPEGLAYDTITGSPDTVVKHYIANNVTSPTDTDRHIPIMSLAANKTGTAIADQTRLKPLSDEVDRVLSINDIGYFFNFVNGSIVFDTYTGTDRTAANISNPPAIFSVDYDNILGCKYIDSVTDIVNTIYVGGSGEGEARTILKVGAGTGAERFESFIDARDTNSTDELTNRALAEMKSEITSYEATANPSANLTYQVDFDLGDKVTVQDREFELTLDTRITEIKEIRQQGQADGLEIMFGNTFPSFLSTINTQRRKIAGLSTI